MLAYENFINNLVHPKALLMILLIKLSIKLVRINTEHMDGKIEIYYIS